MGIFDPSFPEIREENAERRAAIQEIAAKQVAAGPEPTPSSSSIDKLVAVDGETGVQFLIPVSEVAGGGAGSTGSFSALRIGSPTSPAYPIEVYGEALNTNLDKTVMRITGKASNDPSRTNQFWGLSGLRVDMS